MRLLNLSVILFLSSITLIFPLIQPSEEFTILPDEEIRIQKSILTTDIKITLSEITPVRVTIEKLDLAKNSIDVIVLNQTITSEASIPFDETGSYLFIFETSNINKITLDPFGLPLLNLLLILFGALITLVSYLYYYQL